MKLQDKLILNWVILYHDGSKIFITESEAKIFFKADKGDSVIMPRINQRISFSAVKLITDLEGYYQQYPYERPNDQKNFDFLNDNKDRKSSYKNLYSSKNFCKGSIVVFKEKIKEYEQSGKSCNNIKQFLKYAQNRLKQLT